MQSQQQPTMPTTLEERLARTWRSMGTATIHMLSKAEKAAEAQSSGSSSGNNPQQKQQSAATIIKESYQQLDDSVVTFLKTRLEFHRLLHHLEAKLQGKAEEMESLETYIRTEPRTGGLTVSGSSKKRKHDETDADAAAATTNTTTSIDLVAAMTTADATATSTTTTTTGEVEGSASS